LAGYVAWMPDREVTLHRDPSRWHAERLRAFGDTDGHRRLWALLDRLASVFWAASRGGIKLPLRGAGDVVRAARALPVGGWPLVRYLGWTMGDALRACGLGEDRALRGLLGMLLQDTVHSGVDEAPLINGALGVTIRGAGLTRARGGTYGFWRRVLARYAELGGRLELAARVDGVERSGRRYVVQTRRGVFEAPQVVCTLPVQDAVRLAPGLLQEGLGRFVARDAGSLGGALVVFLGVPESEVEGRR